MKVFALFFTGIILSATTQAEEAKILKPPVLISIHIEDDKPRIRYNAVLLPEDELSSCLARIKKMDPEYLYSNRGREKSLHGAGYQRL